MPTPSEVEAMLARLLVAQDEVKGAEGRSHAERLPLLRVRDEANQAFRDAFAIQARAAAWFAKVAESDPTDLPERVNRFIEEALEIGQAFGQTEDEVGQLARYVHSRPVGEPAQELGGGIVTLLLLAAFAGHDLLACGEADLARVDTPEKIAAVRLKRSRRHGRGPLPGDLGKDAPDFIPEKPPAPADDTVLWNGRRVSQLGLALGTVMIYAADRAEARLRPIHRLFSPPTDVEVEAGCRAGLAASRPGVRPDALTPAPRGRVGMVPIWSTYERVVRPALEAVLALRADARPRHPDFASLSDRQRCIAQAIFDATAGGADDMLMDLAAGIACHEALWVEAALAENGFVDGPLPWKDEASAPEGVRLVIYRSGESGVACASLRVWPDGTREWIAPDGRTTVTHGSYAAPTHWLCRMEPWPGEDPRENGRDFDRRLGEARARAVEEVMGKLSTYKGVHGVIRPAEDIVDVVLREFLALKF